MTSAVANALDQWIRETKEQGRIVTRMPTGNDAGQLASRLAYRDAVTGWDYQLAPWIIRQEDNLQDLSGEVAALAIQYSDGVLDLLDDVVIATGAVIHEAGSLAGKGLAAAIGIPPVVLWGGLAFVAYQVVKNPAPVKRIVQRWLP